MGLCRWFRVLPRRKKLNVLLLSEGRAQEETKKKELGRRSEHEARRIGCWTRKSRSNGERSPEDLLRERIPFLPTQRRAPLVFWE